MKKSVSMLVALLIILMSFPLCSFADDTSDILSFSADYFNAQISNDKFMIYTTDRDVSTDIPKESNDSDLSIEHEENQVYEPNAFEKTFQVISLAIMVIGLFGIPVFIFMKSNKKRVEEDEENSSDDPYSENNSEEETNK